MKKIFLALIITLFSLSANAIPVKSEFIVEAVEGQGTDERSAKLDAYRNAIIQAIGVHVKSDTVIENYVVKSDKIKTKAEAFIKDAKLISKKNENGIFSLIYKVTVSTEPVQEDLKSVMGTEFENVGHPVVCVVGNYNGRNRAETEMNVSAVTAMNRNLIKRGYKVIDQSEIIRLRDEDQEIIAASSKSQDEFSQVARMIANKLKADIYVTSFGSVETTKASVSTKIYNSYTGQVFGDDTGYANVIGNSIADAKKAAEDAVSNSMKKILPLMSEYWQKTLTNGQEYIMIFENIEGKQRRALKKVLKSGENDYDVEIHSVKQVNAVPGHVEFSVYASGSPSDLFDFILDNFDQEGIKVKGDEVIQRGGRALFIIEK